MRLSTLTIVYVIIQLCGDVSLATVVKYSRRTLEVAINDVTFKEKYDAIDKLSFDLEPETQGRLKVDDVEMICVVRTEGRFWRRFVKNWRSLECARVVKGSASVNLPTTIDDQTVGLYLIALAPTSDEGKKVIFSFQLPSEFSDLDFVFSSRDSSIRNELEFEVSLKVKCKQDWFGQMCNVFCQPISDRHVCDSMTGEVKCSRGWTGMGCTDAVFIPRQLASQFIKRRPKRANSWLRAEEIWAGNIERECEEESCSREEAREAFEDEELTNQYWLRKHDPNQCEPNPCFAENTNRCEDKLADYTCHCKPGYEGRTCHQTINLCKSEPCQNQAKCMNISGTSFSCACAPGYRGHVCDVNIDDCVDSNCGENGICEDGINSYTCKCDLGFTGEKCDVDVDECSLEPCQNGGNCTDHIGYRTCNCTDEYYGDDCQHRHSPCRSNPCKNDGVCIVQLDYSFICNCGEQFTGDVCQHKVGSPCISEPCHNGGSCYVIMNNVTEEVAEFSGLETNRTMDFKCACNFGFGGKTCDREVGACEFAGHPCPLNATCVDLEDQYLCVCPVGFLGELCDVEGNDTEELDRIFCESNPCQNGARCIHNNNVTTCVCRQGYNGIHCENEIDHCKSNPCTNGASCINSPATFICNCPEGLEGQHCEDDVNECLHQPPLCRNNSTCNNTIASFQCLCGPYNTGKFCEERFDPCESEPCQNGGKCLHGDDGYECLCISGFGNLNCNVIVKPCEDITNQCENNATCTPRLDDPRQADCACAEGFYGRYCEREIDHCVIPGNDTSVENVTGKILNVLVQRDDCGLHGNCVSNRKGFTCVCEPGFIGSRCNGVFSPPVVNCSSAYCQCPSSVLEDLRIKHHVTKLDCVYDLYDKGVCSPPLCLLPNCSLSSDIFCSWDSGCLQKYKKLNETENLNDSCVILEMDFDVTKLNEVETLGQLCQKVRHLPSNSRYKGKVGIHCDVIKENEENITIAVAFDSFTSEVDAFIMAAYTFQRLKEEIRNDDKGVKSLANEVDQFFNQSLLGIRFARHLGHRQRYGDDLSDPGKSEPITGTGSNRKSWVVYALPIALLCLFILILFLIFFLNRRRHKKTLQVNYVTDRAFVNDVIADEATSQDAITVSPTQAMWFKITSKRKKKQKKENESFDNPLFNDDQYRNLTMRPSVTSNDYATSGSPKRAKMTNGNPLKSVSQSTVNYSLQNSPATSRRDPDDVYATGDTIPYGVVGLDGHQGSAESKSQTLGRNNPYDVIGESPYSMAKEPERANDVIMDAKGLYTLAGEFPKPADSPQVLRAKVSPTASVNSSPCSTLVKLPSPPRTPSRRSTGSSASSSKSSSVTPTSGDSGVDILDTRVCSDQEEKYQTPRAVVIDGNPIKETEIPQIYQIPRKANPVD